MERSYGIFGFHEPGAMGKAVEALDPERAAKIVTIVDDAGVRIR